MSSLLIPITLWLTESAIKVALITVILVRGRGRPATRMTWIVVILALPLLGIVLYLLVGEVRLGSRRIRRHREIVKLVTDADLERAVPSDPPPIPIEYRQIATLAESVGDRAAVGGNTLRLIADTNDFIDALVADVDAARDHCHLLFYIFLCDDSGRAVVDALCRAAARGVACRLLVDAVGSKTLLRSRWRAELDRAGVRVVAALPVNPLRMLFARIDLRNHRKLVVIDDAIAYAGSQNIANASFAPKQRFAPWVDVMVRAEGPIARDLQVLFTEDWYLDTDESLVNKLSEHPAPAPDGSVAQAMGTGPSSFNAAMKQLVHAAIHTAREELILTTPYFVPDEALLTALQTAARRGVEVSLVVPARNDSPLVAAASRGFYDPLLGCGVQIHEFLDGLLHSKTLTIDRGLALVGSANLDRRSFELNLEVSLLVYDTDFASQVRFLQRDYIGRSRRVSPAAWPRRRWPQRLAENAAATLSPLL